VNLRFIGVSQGLSGFSKEVFRMRTHRAKSAGLGWIRDNPDPRDHIYAPPSSVLSSLPSRVDLRGKMPPVYNQGEFNSCTANAVAAALQFDEIKQGGSTKASNRPSRMFIYYNERLVEGTEEKDAGAQIRDGIKSVAKQGDCPERLWPYKKANLTVKPYAKCYLKARRYRAVEYQRMQHRMDQLKTCLASGYPFVFGFRVYESFLGRSVRETGLLYMPKVNEKGVGLHAVLASGYDDQANRFIVRNSWGKKWGVGGYFTMPYDYLLDPELAHDFWTIRVVR
jgi:C1A family cysteine protease